MENIELKWQKQSHVERKLKTQVPKSQNKQITSTANGKINVGNKTSREDGAYSATWWLILGVHSESHAPKVSPTPWDSGTAEYIWKLFDNSGAEGKNYNLHKYFCTRESFQLRRSLF